MRMYMHVNERARGIGLEFKIRVMVRVRLSPSSPYLLAINFNTAPHDIATSQFASSPDLKRNFGPSMNVIGCRCRVSVRFVIVCRVSVRVVIVCRVSVRVDNTYARWLQHNTEVQLIIMCPLFRVNNRVYLC